MLTRSMTSTMSGRAAAARRLRRRASATSGRRYCPTNGCATFMTIDLEAGLATCPVCHAVRRIG
jgi:hypothetical protein